MKVKQGDKGPEFATGIAKFLQPICAEVCDQVGAEVGDMIFFGSGTFADVCKYLHYVRTRLATILDIIIVRVYTRRAVGLLSAGRLASGGWFSIEGAAK